MASPPSTRDLILGAALAAFDEAGYGSTSMSDIRRVTGVSTGSLYHHFPGKQQLAAALFVQGLADYQQGFLVMLRRAPDAQTGIRGGVVFHLRWARENRAMARFLLRAMDADIAAAARADAGPMSRRFLREVHEWLEEPVGAGRILRLPRELLYPIWIGPAQELVRQWLGGRAKTAVGEAEATLADNAWRSLRA